MQFGLFGSAAARRGGPEFVSSEGFRDFIEYNIEAEALGFHSTFVVEHHFTGYGQVSATLNLLTWLGARTRRLRLGTAVIVLPWHNPVLLEAGGDPGSALRGPPRFRHRQGLPLQRIRRILRADGRGRRKVRRGPRRHPQGMDRRRAVFPPRPILAVRQHRRRTTDRAEPASAYLDGRRRRTLDSPRRAARLHLLLGQYASPEDVGRSIAVYRDAVEASRRRFDPMQVGVTRAFFVSDNPAEKEAAMERRLKNRMRQLRLATQPNGTVHGGPDHATGDPRMVNEVSAIYGTPNEIAHQLETLRESGVGYVLMNGGGSGGGARGRDSLRRFAREVMPLFAEAPPKRLAV
jgi:alkanesulfonate monooxygenase SsuD/methylene tetrahydromethanopterin reductase-like flavin-dependent oxidoreductase (luciferase family)